MAQRSIWMPTASDRRATSAKKLGDAARSSNETPVSSAEHPNPKHDGIGNTAETRPHPQGAKLTPEEIAQTSWQVTDEGETEQS